MKTQFLPLPNGRAIFCDDIRYEVGSKTSLIGIYNGLMQFPAGITFPLLLPKFCVAIIWNEPIEGYADEITFEALFVNKDAEPDGGGEQQLAKSHYNLKEMGPAALIESDKTPNRLMTLTAHLIASPLAIPHAGKIRVRAKRDDELIAIGALRVEIAPE